MTKEALQCIVDDAGTWTSAAEYLGVSETTIRRWSKKLGVTLPKQEVIATANPDPVLKQENEQLRRQVKNLTEGATSSEAILRRLERSIEQNHPQYQLSLIKHYMETEKTSQEAVLLFSDTHASEVVSLEETRGINEYNWPIMLSRMQKIKTAIVSHTEHLSFPVSKLHVFMLGDMLSGDIHEELAITNDRPTAEAIVQMAYDTAEFLVDLHQYFGEVHVVGVVGNHPRRSKKPSMKQAHNNADWLLYKMVEALLKDVGKFSFDFPLGSMATTMVCDRYRFLLVHGDGIRTSMPGVPWGGVVRRVSTLESQMSKARQPLDFIAMGHWHSQQQLGGIQAKTWINGSVKGPDEYGLRNYGFGHDAEQTLLTFHPRNGWTAQYAINLQEGKQPAGEGWK